METKSFEKYLARIKLHHETNLQGLFVIKQEGVIMNATIPCSSLYNKMASFVGKYCEVVVFSFHRYVENDPNPRNHLMVVGFDYDVELYVELMTALVSRIENAITVERIAHRRLTQHLRRKSRKKVETLNLPHFRRVVAKYIQTCIHKSVHLMKELLEKKKRLPREVALVPKMKEVNYYIKHALGTRTLKRRLYAR